jgi:hypothetical protein
MAASFLLLRTAGTTIEEAGVSRLWKRHKLSLLESLSIHDEVVLEDGSPLLREMKRMGRNDPECDVPEAQLRTFFADGLHMQCRADWLLELAETEDWQRFSDAYQSLHRAGADGIVFSAAQRAVWERKGPEFAATVAAFNTNREEVESLVRDGTASSTTSTTSTTSAILTDDLDSVITIFSDDPGIHISPAMMARLQALHAESLPESLWPVARRIAGSPPGDIRRQWFFFLAARGDKIRYAWRKPQLRTLFLQLWSEKMGPLERNTLWLAWDRLFRDAESSLGPPTDAALADRIRNAAAEARLVREVE